MSCEQMPGHDPEAEPTPDAAGKRIDAPGQWQHLRLPHYEHDHPPFQDASAVHQASLTPLDRFALTITNHVGSNGFLLIVLAWTVLWTGYNILASSVPALHWRVFDPFPAFVAYLLINNVLQNLLMPLIMVGQNLQSRYSDTRSQLDFEINQKSEKEVMVLVRHLEHNTDLLLQLMRYLECRVSEEELRAITAEKKLADQLLAMDTTTEMI